MALTVGELVATITVNDRDVRPALRRTEQAFRRTGQQLGSDADRAGQQAGQQLGGGFIRGADGQWRNLRGELVDATTAATLEAEGQARRGGQQTGRAFNQGLNQQTRQAGDDLADGVRRGGDDAADAAGRAGDDAGGSFVSRLRERTRSGAGEAASGFREEFTGKLALAAVGTAAAGLLIDGFNQALEQQQITARLSAQLGATPAQAKRYGEAAGELFKHAVVENFEEGAETVRAVASAGLVPPDATVAQLSTIGTKVSDVAKTFDLDLGETATAVGQLIRTKMVPDATTGLDLIAKSLEGTDKRAEDILETTTEYSPVFHQLGIDGATAFGLVRQGAQAGAKDTDKVADAVKELSLQVTSGGKAQMQSLKDLGLNATQVADDIAAGGSRGRKGLDQVLDALRKMPKSAKRAQAIQNLFGGPGEDLGAALFALDVDKASKSLDGAAGSAEKLGSGLRDNAAARVTEFKNTLQQDLVQFLGDKVIPVISKVFDFLQEHQGTAKAIAVGVTALGAAFAVAAIGVWAMNSALLANPIFWIIAGIVAAVVLVITYWDEIKAYTLQSWETIKALVSVAVDGILMFIGYLASIPGKVADWFGRAKDWAIKKMLELTAWLVGLPGRAQSAIASLGAKIVSVASSAWQRFKDAAVSKASSFLRWAAGLPGQIKRKVGSLNSVLWSAGRNVITGLWNGISSLGGWLWTKVKNFVSSNVVGAAKSFLHIGSPSKLMASAVGRWIPAGVAKGIEDHAGVVDDAMSGLVTTPTPSASFTAGVNAAAGSSSGRAGAQPVVIQLRADGSRGGAALLALLREAVKPAGGNVQFAVTGRNG